MPEDVNRSGQEKGKRIAIASLWEGLLAPDDIAYLERGGYGSTANPGSRPLLVIADLQQNTIGPALPGGPLPHRGANEVLTQAVKLARVSRTNGIPTVFACLSQRYGLNPYGFKIRRPVNTFAHNHEGTRLAPELESVGADLVLEHEHTSLFGGTALDGYLRGLGNPDTLLLAGISTAGVIRQTAVDAAARFLKVVVVIDACTDTIEISHRVAALELWMRYADLMDVDSVSTYMAACSNWRSKS